MTDFAPLLTETPAEHPFAPFVRILGTLLKDPNIGKLIVPIVPDESRTFSMESLFHQIGIRSAVG